MLEFKPETSQQDLVKTDGKTTTSMNTLKCRTLAATYSKWPHLQFLDLDGIFLSHLGHFFIGPGFNLTFPLTINSNAIIKQSQAGCTLLSSHYTSTFHILHYFYVFHTNFHHLYTCSPWSMGRNSQWKISFARLRSWWKGKSETHRLEACLEKHAMWNRNSPFN